jgi:hypothetical protein
MGRVLASPPNRLSSNDPGDKSLHYVGDEFEGAECGEEGYLMLWISSDIPCS